MPGYEEVTVRPAEVAENVVFDFGYNRYCELGGIINRTDYFAAMMVASLTTHLDKSFIGQAESVCSGAGITIFNSWIYLDPITKIYAGFRDHIVPNAQYDHGQMGDQAIMGQVARSLGAR